MVRPVNVVTYTPPMRPVYPGDWFVVDPGEAIFDRIEWAERLAEWAEHHRDPKWRATHRDPDWYRWGHAGVATRWAGQHTPGCPRLRAGGNPCTCGAVDDPVLMIAEAEPGGAVERPWHWESHPHMWSTGTGLSVPPMGPAAYRYTQPGPWGDHGVPYSFPDYGAIAAKALHLPVPGLDAYLADSSHMQCAELTDQTAQDCAVHLFDDGRPPGYVMPLDLALLLEAKGVQPHA